MISGEPFPLPTDAPEQVAALFARCGITDDPAGVVAVDQGADGTVWLERPLRSRPGFGQVPAGAVGSMLWQRATVETPAWVREWVQS